MDTKQHYRVPDINDQFIPNEQAGGCGSKKNLPEMTRKKSLWVTRLKMKLILIWATPDSVIINNFSSINVYRSAKCIRAPE